MIVHRRSPRAWVFSVDQDAAQVSWRGLRPGRLRIEPRTRSAPVAEPIEVELAPAAHVLAATAGAGAGDQPRVGRADAGAVTLPGLPAGRLLTLRLSGSALDAPVELAARTLSALPGAELTRLATISDLHLGVRAFGQRGSIVEVEGHADPHPLRCATAAIDAATAWGATRIVAKGDLTNGGQPDQWRAYARLVAASPLPIEAIAGNHDAGAYGPGTALTPREAAAAFGFHLASPLEVHDRPGVRVVLADTTVPGANRGRLAAVAADLVDAVAEAPPDVGVLVVLHHHLQPLPVPAGPPIGIGPREGMRLLDRLGAAHPHVLVTSGHTHRHRRWGRAGVTVTQVGSTKDYPGVWAGYRVHEGGLAQIVRRIEDPSCIGWLDRTRLAGYGVWEHVAPGRLDARCFDLHWHVAGDAPTAR